MGHLGGGDKLMAFPNPPAPPRFLIDIVSAEHEERLPEYAQRAAGDGPLPLCCDFPGHDGYIAEIAKAEDEIVRRVRPRLHKEIKAKGGSLPDPFYVESQISRRADGVWVRVWCRRPVKPAPSSAA